MAEQPITDEVAAALCAKLKKCGLTQAERTLLEKALKVARHTTNPHAQFDLEFDDCFEPGEAALIMKYSPLLDKGSITKLTEGGGSTTIPIN